MTSLPTDRGEGARIGIGFTPFETRPDVILGLAAHAEDLGLERVDVAEGWTHDGTILVAELALRTSRIGLGTGVISTWGRSPATVALAAAGLQRVSAGRFSLGIGASSPPLVEGLHGIAWEPPGPQLRKTLTAVRGLLSGDRLPDPPPGARPLRLGVVPEVPVPLALAALAPASIRLAGELADSWMPFLWSKSFMDYGRALLAEGEARRELPGPPGVSLAVPAALGADEQSARELAGWWLTTYVTRMGPIYPKLLSGRFGMAAGVEALIAAAGPGSARDLPPAADQLAHEVTLLGTYDRAADALAPWFAAGADTVSVVLPPGRPEDELVAIVEAVAAAVSADRDLLHDRAAPA